MEQRSLEDVIYEIEILEDRLDGCKDELNVNLAHQLEAKREGKNVSPVLVKYEAEIEIDIENIESELSKLYAEKVVLENEE